MIDNNTTTIVAISTAPAKGAIAIVRISGNNAINIAKKIFVPTYQKELSSMRGYTAAYGNVVLDGMIIDEGVATVFLEPKSYTGEDMVEISCHGNPLVAGQIFEALVKSGAKPAGAGEFTKRAFLNGKMDLTQAEAVCELISATGRGAARLALEKRSGTLVKKIDSITEGLTNMAAKIAVWVDYPDDEFMSVEHSDIELLCKESKQQLDNLISGYSKAVMITQGVTAAIVGKPNAGKSTTMNLLCQSDRSIVSEYAGTTRDVVETVIDVGRCTIKLLDTAGIRTTDDPIECLGVDRAKAQIDSADIVIAVLEAGSNLNDDEKKMLENLADRVCIVVINKQDLHSDGNIAEKIKLFIPNAQMFCSQMTQDQQSHNQLIVGISALTGDGESNLRLAIEVAVGLCSTADNRLIANERQLDCVIRCSRALEVVISASQNYETLDAISVLLDEAVEPMWELTGKNASDEIINEVFSKFCVGK